MKKEVNEQLVESSLLLQSKLVDFIKELKHSNQETNESINKLNKKLNDLLNLFESATSYVKSNKEVDPLIPKLEELTKQNKEIAKSLILIERALREQTPTTFRTKPLR